MSIRIRYAFFSILVIIFLVTTPIVILYTAGYRYNFVKNKIEKTGILVLNSGPEDASIFINDSKQKNTTETRIKNLLPNTYLVRIEKEGYHPWEKLLEVKSKLTTFAENVLLFKKTIPLQVVSGDVPKFSLSNDKKTLAYISDNSLKTLNLKDKTGAEIYKSTSKIIDITWAPGDKKILIEEKYYPHFKVIDISDKNEIFVPKNHFGINFKELKWNKKNGNTLHGLKLSSLKTGTLYQIDLENKETTATVPVGNTFIAGDNVIYTTEFVNKNDFLFRRSFDRPEDATEITVLPTGDYKFLNFKENYLTLLHLDRGELVFINLDEADDNTILETKVTDSVWVDEDTDKLLIKKDFEILVHDFVSDQRSLITRYGEEIVKAVWHPQGEYLFFSMDKNIQVIELDGRGGNRNKITLVEFDGIGAFALDEGAEKIYFSGKVGNQEGIYELEIQ